jgi:glycosyltransferase involved in cell wall biosynthesis
MRVLHVTPHYFPELQFGGPPVKIHALNRGLAAMGIQTRVVTLDSRDPSRNTTEMLDGIPVRYLPWLGRTKWQVPHRIRALKEIVAAADVIHCYGLYNLICPMAARLAHGLNRPLVIEPLGMYAPKTGHRLAKLMYHRLFTARMFRQASSMIAASGLEAEQWRGAVKESKIVIRRNGIDPEQFQPLPPPNIFRERLGLVNGERVILFLGRISPVKNLELLVDAFAAAKISEAKLVLAGPAVEPAYQARLQQAICRCGVEKQVFVTGALYGPDKLKAFAAADLFVLPSVSESFGNAAAEAVAAGVPVLVTETCGIAPIIHHRAGLAIPAEARFLASALKELLEDPHRLAALTARRLEAIDQLTWQQPLELTLQLYCELTAPGTAMPASPRR